MLEASWEVYSTTLANADTDEDLVTEYLKLAEKLGIDTSKPANVVIARDTRESGPALVKALTDALDAVDAKYVDHGILTTPQLHYIVRCINTQNTADPYGEPTEDGYYKKLGDAYRQLMKGVQPPTEFTVDCANGVGAPALHKLAEYIGSDLLKVKIINDRTDVPSELNFQVGPSFSSFLTPI